MLMLQRASKKIEIIAETPTAPKSLTEAGCDDPLTKMSCLLGNPLCPTACKVIYQTSSYHPR